MAIEWNDSFGNLPTDSGPRGAALGVDYSLVGSIGYSQAGGPDGRPCLTFGQSANGLERDFGAVGTVWWHTLYRLVSAPTGSDGNRVIAQAKEGSTIHVSIRLEADGSVTALRGAGTGTVLATSAPGIIAPSAWHAIGVQVTCHDSGGAVRVLVDGVEVLNESGVDTRNGGSGVLNRLRVGPLGNSLSGTQSLRHLLIGDTTGAAPFDGVIPFWRADYLPVLGAGGTAQWTPNTGTNHGAVNDVHPDDDTTFNESDTVGHKDIFGIEQLASIADTVGCVQLRYRDRKTEPGDSDVRGLLVPDTTEYPESPAAQSETWVSRRGALHLQNPEGPTAWTPQAVRDLRVGYEKTA